MGNAVGRAGSGAVAAGLTWVVAQLGVSLNPALVALISAAAFAGGVAFALIHQRYAAILTRRGPHERAAYDTLRGSLAEGGLAARTYARRLSAALDAVDRFFGDAGMADRTLWPRAFGLRTPAPLWTAPAFDRCLLLALLYPIATIFVMWAVSGHVGPAEHALGLSPDLPGWRRASASAGLAFASFAFWRGARAPGLLAMLEWYAVAGVGAVAAAVAGAAAVGVAVASAGPVVGTGVVGVGTGVVGVGAVAVAVAVAGIGVGAVAVAVTVIGAVAVAGAVSGAVAGAVAYLNYRAARNQWQGRFQVLFLLVMILACCVATDALAEQKTWPIAGPLLLFLGLLTLINAPFDWASLGLTRGLLRRGLELGAWWPYLLALADAVLAAGIIAVLTIVTVISVQAFDDVAAHAGSDGARILPLGALLDGIAAHPGAPEYWWVYALLLSTMIPSLVNLAIGGASLLRGVPWLAALLLRNMPERGAPPAFERAWMTLLLTLQVFLGGLLGIAAQVFLAYAVIGLALPLLGLDLLELARAVAAPDLPGQVVGWFASTPSH